VRRTTVPAADHEVYAYLLRELVIERPDHVRCADITYIPMQRGFMYLVAIMEWASRKVLAWRYRARWTRSSVSKHWRRPSANTANRRFTRVLKEAGVNISMDGKGLDGQCFHRAALAITEIRVRLSARIRDRDGGAQWDSSLGGILRRCTSFHRGKKQQQQKLAV
jgi:hypothetical protein